MPQSSISQWLRGSPSTSVPTNCQSNGGFKSSQRETDTHKIVDVSNDSGTNEGDAFPAQQKQLFSPQSQSLPANVVITHCTHDYIQSFRRLNALLLPIPYPDYFYKETMEDQIIASVTRIALWYPSENLRHGNSVIDNLPSNSTGEAKLVAGIRCRMLDKAPHLPGKPEPVLYISTIGTLAPFRELALASHLLDEVLSFAAQQFGICSVYAHVWEANQPAMEWYLKRGFTILQKEEEYYKRLAPQTAAWLIKRDIRTSDMLGGRHRRKGGESVENGT